MSACSPLHAPPPQALRRSYTVAPPRALATGWSPAQLWARAEWRVELDWTALKDLLAAVHCTRDLPVEALHTGRVESAAVDALAARMHRELHQGSGVVWLRGLQGLSETVQRRTYALLSAKLGEPLDTYGRQYDVRDSGKSYTQEAIPVSQTRAETSFHTDSSSVRVEPAVVGLLCIRPARVGGSSLISSGLRAHHSLSPETLALLYRDYVRNIVTPGLNNLDIFKNRFPIFRWSPEDGLSMRYMRYWIEKGHERVGWQLQPAETQALDRLDAALTANQVSFDLGSGDIVWMNNRTVTHNRTAFEDDPAHPRLMVRMWLTRTPASSRS